MVSKRRRLESLESLVLHRHCWSPKPSFRSWSFRWKASKVTSPSIHLKILRSFIVIFSWCYDLLHPIQFLIIFAANLLTDEYRSLSLSLSLFFFLILLTTDLILPLKALILVLKNQLSNELVSDSDTSSIFWFLNRESAWKMAIKWCFNLFVVFEL